MNIHYIYGALLKIKSKSNKFKKCQITLKHCLRITTIGYRSSLATTLTWKVIIKRPFMHDLSCILYFCLLSGAGCLCAAVWAPDVWAPALMREEIGFYRPIIISSIPFKLSDENDACFTVIEAGWTDINVFTYSSMKITRVSLQSKLDELLLFLH